MKNNFSTFSDFGYESQPSHFEHELHLSLQNTTGKLEASKQMVHEISTFSFKKTLVVLLTLGIDPTYLTCSMSFLGQVQVP